MKKLGLLSGLLVIFVVIFMHSCIDKSYDDINKEGEFSQNGIIVPIGQIDTIHFGDISEIDIVDIPVPEDKVFLTGVSDTIAIFDEDIIDYFFYPGGGSVSLISDSAKIQIGDEPLGGDSIYAKVSFAVLDENYQECKYKGNTVNIEPIDLVSWAKTTKIEIKFPEDSMEAMQTAKYMVFYYVMGANHDFQLVYDDYVFFKALQLKKVGGGIHFNL